LSIEKTELQRQTIEKKNIIAAEASNFFTGFAPFSRRAYP
jgi:hypothetical protein